MTCNVCVGGWHEFCKEPFEDACCCESEEAETLATVVGQFLNSRPGRNRKIDPDQVKEKLELSDDSPEATVTPIKRPRGRPPLPDHLKKPKKVAGLVKEYKNAVAAGRKRANTNYPITDGMACEWAGLKNAGGGVRPVVGCRKSEEKIAEHIHHGPDKSTMNNEPGVNIHRICSICHNRWHTLNDDYYGIRPEDAFAAYLPKPPLIAIPHDPTTMATTEDYADSDKYWSLHRPRRARHQ